MNRSLHNYQTGGPKPTAPEYDGRCSTNQFFQAIPETKRSGVTWQKDPMPPATTKTLYGEPNNYPMRYIHRPRNTLYGHTYFTKKATGVGSRKHSEWDSAKPYPLTNRSIGEIAEYTDYTFPQPQPSTVRYGYEVVNVENSREVGSFR